MRTLRQKTKAIMIVVAASFLIGFVFLQLGIGTGGRHNQQVRNVGVINGVEISHDDFFKAQNNIIAQLRQQGKDNLTDEDYDRVEQQTWNEMVFQILVHQEIEDRGIVISEEEVRNYLIDNPPDFIKSNESFQVDGQFSHEQYVQILNAPENRQFTANLETWIRQTLPQVKLSSQMALGIDFSDADLLRRFKERKEEVKVGYAFFASPPPRDGKAVTGADGEAGDLLPPPKNDYEPSESEIAEYYQSHEKDFVDDERAVIQYLSFSLIPTKKDTLEARQKASLLVQRIRKGEDFAVLAEEFSKDATTAEKGGDLGFLKKGEVLSSLEGVAFSMEPGQTSDPVLTPRGWHVVKVEERRGGADEEEVHLRHILIPIQITLATRDSVNGLVRDVFDDLNEQTGSFEEVAARENLSVKETTAFTKEEYVPELGPIMKEASSFAFSRDVDAVSQSISRLGMIYIIRISQRIPERTKSLEEVREEIALHLTTEKEMADLKKDAESLLVEAKALGGLEAACSRLGIDYKITPSFTRRDYVPGVGMLAAFTGYAHALPVGRIGGPIRTDKGYYVIEVMERKEADMAEFEKTRDDLKAEMMSDAKSKAFEQWFSSLLKNADIEDNRLFFGFSS